MVSENEILVDEWIEEQEQYSDTVQKSIEVSLSTEGFIAKIDNPTPTAIFALLIVCGFVFFCVKSWKARK